MQGYYVHESSYIDEDVEIGAGTKDIAFLSYPERGKIGKELFLWTECKYFINVKLKWGKGSE